jgi:hypothetical protein
MVMMSKWKALKVVKKASFNRIALKFEIVTAVICISCKEYWGTSDGSAIYHGNGFGRIVIYFRFEVKP